MPLERARILVVCFGLTLGACTQVHQGALHADGGSLPTHTLLTEESQRGLPRPQSGAPESAPSAFVVAPSAA